MPDEGDYVEHRREHTGSHTDRRVRRHARILSEPVFRVPILALPEMKLTETIVRQPAIDQMPGQPCPPLALHRHARPDRQDRHQDAQTGEQQEKQRLHPERGTVPATERIEKIPAALDDGTNQCAAADQRALGDRCQVRHVPQRAVAATLHRPSGRILRVETGRGRPAALRDRSPGRAADGARRLCVRRPVSSTTAPQNIPVR